MPENPIIQEGGSGRRMGSIGRIITFGSSGNDLWVPASERLTAPKFISKNGVYIASDEELFAFSKLTVNVYGGAPGMTEPTTPTGPYGVETPTGETPAVIPAIPGGPGSSISGIDPTDGQQYTATVNPDGTISTIRSPAGIRVAVPPDKLNYVNGEKIDYHGLVIELLDAQGNVFTDSNYPDGRIAWSETRHEHDQSKPYLNLNVDTPIETATGGGTDVERYMSEDGSIVAVLFTSHYEQWLYRGLSQRWYSDWMTVPLLNVQDSRGLLPCAISVGGSQETEIFLTRYVAGNGYEYLYAARKSGNGSAFNPIEYMTSAQDSHYPNGGWATHATTAYTTTTGRFTQTPWGEKSPEGEYLDRYAFPAPLSTSDPTEFDINDFVAAGSPVTVQWQSPYDWTTYEAQFDIRVTGTDGGGEGGESSGGGGGGHGF